MQGQIVKILSDLHTVSANNKSYKCKCRGKFRKNNIIPQVGDYVLFDEKQAVINEVLPRKNCLVRPRVSNIDQAFIITSVKHPNFSTNLLDKLLVIMEFNSIKPIICLTKIDLLSEIEKEEILKITSYYEKIGYTVIKNTEIDKVKAMFKNKTSVFTGQSGAGKSTLLNTLDVSLKLETDEISMALGRGKHTTRHVELIELFEGKVLDTPGFSSLDFTNMTPLDISNSFVEFNNYPCKFKDCKHLKEEDCNIKNQVEQKVILKSRYENYIKIIRGDKIENSSVFFK